MKKISAQEVKNIWVNFFKKKQHKYLISHSLVPQDDNSLLWINSGVAALKKYFSGQEKPPATRIVNIQKAIRTNDIEKIGKTSRHHSFFEMLGNFSIGDYFKKYAIEMAYELLFQEFNFPKNKIYITYYEKDDETYQLWKQLGIDGSHLISGNKSQNFWDLGQGPCGSNTEMFFDRGKKYDPQNLGIKLLKEDIENDRYIEIWNIVFSEFNNNGHNQYQKLRQKNIDTGAGLERIAAILQDVPTNFDTDLFEPLIKFLDNITDYKYQINNYFIKDQKQNFVNELYCIIVDHIRAVVIAINDGVHPSNEGREYIVRRLIRRAYRAGIQLAITKKTFLHEMTKIVDQLFPEYKINVKYVEKIIFNEELIFSKTIQKGEKILKEYFIKNKGQKEMSFAFAFKLFETYGFPIELTQEIAKQNKINLNIDKFQEYKSQHAIVSKNTNFQKAIEQQINIIQSIDKKCSSFIGYDKLEVNSEIIFSGQENGLFYILVKKTPFFPTSGGQKHDYGQINGIDVLDVFYDKYQNIWHVVKKNILTKNVFLKVDTKMHLLKTINHSATHLLNKALHEVFGQQIKQVGSYNDENKLRFDFKLFANKITNQEIQEIEKKVNSYIKANYQRQYQEVSLAEAKKMHALFLDNFFYNEKKVRVVNFVNLSVELCGGTHVSQTSLIEKFKIIKKESKGSHIFRIEAITTDQKIQEYENKVIHQKNIEIVRMINKIKKIDDKYSLNYVEKNQSLQEVAKTLEQVKKDYYKIINNNDFNPQNYSLNDANFKTIDHKKIYQDLNINKQNIKKLIVFLKNKFPDILFIIGSKIDSQTFLIASSSAKYHSLEELKKIYPKFNGGGNKNFAMGKVEI